MTTVQEVIEKLTLPTDLVKEVEALTEKHYSLNRRFIVIRNEKQYFISVKTVDVMGQIIKSHVRLDVDTDLPKKAKPVTKKEMKIIELVEKVNQAKIDRNRYEYDYYKWSLIKLRGY